MSDNRNNPWEPPNYGNSGEEQPQWGQAPSEPPAQPETPRYEHEPTTEHQAQPAEPTTQHTLWQPPGSGNVPPYGGGYAADDAFTPGGPPPRRSGGGFFRWLAVAVVSALIGGGVGAAVANANDDTPVRSDAPATVKSDAASNAPATPTNIRGVLNKVEPAVVSIQVSSSQGSGSGTGMIISSDGEVLTNNHVVTGATKITVTLNGEKDARTARLLGVDPTIDSALIKVDGVSNLPTVEFGDSEALQVGDEVVAIGNALGLAGGPSVTSGIVSAKDRSISDDTASLDDLIQTDTAINPGNSGGPLANLAGQVVGMNTAVIRGSEGEYQNIGFSLSINTIKPALDDLRAGKSSALAYLGVSTVTLDESTKARYDLTPDAGAIVDSVVQNSPADDAGLARFDVITGFDGQDVGSNDELVTLVRKKKPGDKVQVVYYRGSDKKEVTATLAARPTENQ